MKKPEEISTEEIVRSLEKVTDEIQDVRYFNGELVNKIERMAANAASFQMLAAILAGKSPEAAGQIAADSILPLTFHLGLLVGQEVEASDAFTQMMMGGFNGPSADAGDTEHGDE